MSSAGRPHLRTPRKPQPPTPPIDTASIQLQTILLPPLQNTARTSYPIPHFPSPTFHAPACRVMPGTLARHYAAAGGPVVLMGKPAPVIYRAALDMLGLPPSEVVAVGDSLEHDIGGAQAAGVDSLFVLGGIHRQDVGLVNGTADGTAAAAEAVTMAAAVAGLELEQAGGYRFCRQRLAQACKEHGVAAPAFVVPYFAWQ